MPFFHQLSVRGSFAETFKKMGHETGVGDGLVNHEPFLNEKSVHVGLPNLRAQPTSEELLSSSIEFFNILTGRESVVRAQLI